MSVRPTTPTAAVWWVFAMILAVGSGTALTLQTGNLGVAAFIGVTVLALGISLKRWST